ncbi:MAG: DNA repair protein RadA [Candidatus Magasanikbacteria bacterium CG10_big_fil_rev_8_21_14_0_10_36_32]|uniref:DNA repair protein RadA n=1 Tax=Candidatus Magasanikbacteria bacterium CG10_big_fil_rev_8_21_14_0_10_36_32 TaxID=1974646 RepID=A0A2M6W6K2_9BACT|nr:MAG: DNA repair protein RadA [Candidatus Magasanikbacteria bacterium CG10_big_fil_rev_8_21_14_0_10_36_32]
MKNNQIFSCSNCGAQFQKWVGRCLECGKWGTIDDKPQIQITKKQNNTENYALTSLSTLSSIKSENAARIKTNVNELDRVLGGGFVPGSLILLGGEPGIGKSTLALQLSSIFAHTLYLSGEESIEQIKIRSERLKINSPTLQIGNETNVEKIVATIRKIKPPMAIVDSIQTISSNEAEGEAGNITQVRACTVKLMEAAKTTGTTIILVGQVTKEGSVAGPKSLEHLVDMVLYLEGDRFHQFRILRAAKNRFGSTDEVGVFSMEENGLQEVKNPSAAFLNERSENPAGNVIACLMEGSRPILIEIQALVNKTSFGYPVRKASGFDLNRLHVLIAVLQKRAGLHLEQFDVHLNIVGGLTANEPAADLAVAMAVVGAYKDKPLGTDLAAFGEIGLSGEIRPVSFTEKRLKECEQLGLKRVITNLGNQNKPTKIKSLKVIGIKNIQDIIKHT